ncbi:16S rRNA (uracil(1498)-N(3))-methyltransferase [Demequina globuliformis]|uniref:16S rRNA (uracil(1498)-N(3))-methyltransferase n=1 Tax=Demequina globuliformis TaxID=676202 RepID=UPI0009FCFF8D|nr:16S rRNA (uracil(1498)-N(3))-methyltransferase [Demequina globuliformis]
MSAPVFVDPAAANAVPGALIDVRGSEARHAVTVQRREVGETVDIVDGHGTRARGVIEGAAGDLLQVRVGTVAHEADAPVTLVQALAKGGRDEQAVEAAVELGVTRVVPWAAARSIVQWRGPKADKGRAKWESLVVAASKQSRRAFVAPVDAVASTRDLCHSIGPAVAAGDTVLVLHEDATVPLTSLSFAGPATPEPARAVWLIVGPEGGIAAEELEQFQRAGATAVRLGPHVLRASSAGPAAMAALAAVRGTWDNPAGFAQGATGQADAPTGGELR